MHGGHTVNAAARSARQWRGSRPWVRQEGAGGPTVQAGEWGSVGGGQPRHIKLGVWEGLGPTRQLEWVVLFLGNV